MIKLLHSTVTSCGEVSAFNMFRKLDLEGLPRDYLLSFSKQRKREPVLAQCHSLGYWFVGGPELGHRSPDLSRFQFHLCTRAVFPEEEPYENHPILFAWLGLKCNLYASFFCSSEMVGNHHVIPCLQFCLLKEQRISSI